MLKWLKRLVLALLFGCVLLALAWICKAPLLRGAAGVWIINQPLSPADAIVVLGGGLENRPYEAARLYQQGLAPRILVMNPRPSPPVELGLMAMEGEIARNILLALKVPTNAIILPTILVTNSYDESIVVRDWAQANGIKSVIIPTDIFHTRRVRWLYGKELRATGIRVQIEAVPTREYAATNWWQNESGIIAFQNEVLKFAYYRLKY